MASGSDTVCFSPSPSPSLSYQKKKKVNEKIKIRDIKERRANTKIAAKGLEIGPLRATVAKLPQFHRFMLHNLCQFLNRVASFGKVDLISISVSISIFL